MPFVHLHAPEAVPASSDRCFVVQADRLLAAPDIASAVRLPDMATVSGWLGVSARPLHLGRIDGQVCWTCAVGGAETAPPPGFEWHDSRSLLGVFTPEQAQALSCARQLLWWDRRHRFCGVCGTPMADLAEERARRCPKCQALYYPTASPAVIVAVTRGDQLLLAHNRNFRAGMFSVLAGFVDPGETLEQTIVREVREEVGIEVGDIRYVASQPWPFPNSLMLGFRARHVSGEIAVDGKEIEQAGWYRREALPEIPRPGTVARDLIERWLRE